MEYVLESYLVDELVEWRADDSGPERACESAV